MQLAQMDVKPRFETEAIKGKTYQRNVYTHDGKGLKATKKETKRGYMVYFPQGHSIHVRDDVELKRLGFHRTPALVDMTTGEELPAQLNTSLKERSARMTKPSRGNDGAETLDELQAEGGK